MNISQYVIRGIENAEPYWFKVFGEKRHRKIQEYIMILQAVSLAIVGLLLFLKINPFKF